MVTKNSSTCNPANLELPNPKLPQLSPHNLGAGNIIPHLWYHRVLRNCGKPDTVSISVLSDLARLYCDSSGRCREFQLSYSDLSSKFNYTERQLYAAVARLEQKGLISRAARPKEIDGKNTGNFLYLTLNIDVLLALTETNDFGFGNNSSDNDDSGFGNTIDDNIITDVTNTDTDIQNKVGVIDKTLSILSIDNNYLVINNRLVKDRLLDLEVYRGAARSADFVSTSKSSFIQDVSKKSNSTESVLAKSNLINFALVKSGTITDHASVSSNESSTNVYYADASTFPQVELYNSGKSNFKDVFKAKTKVNIDSCTEASKPTLEEPKSTLKFDSTFNASKSKATAGTSSSTITVGTSVASKPTLITPKKLLGDFHPLSEDDAEHLRVLSGREFNLNFVNQLLLKLAGSKQEHSFASKRMFMSYMSKALKYELRQAVIVNNEGFKLKALKAIKETDAETETDRIESYLAYVENSRNSTSNASPFEQLRKKIACIFAPRVAYSLLTKAKFFEQACDGVFKITLADATVLTEHSKDMLLSAVRATYGEHINSLEVIEGVVNRATKSSIAATVKPAEAEEGQRLQHLQNSRQGQKLQQLQSLHQPLRQPLRSLEQLDSEQALSSYGTEYQDVTSISGSPFLDITHAAMGDTSGTGDINSTDTNSLKASNDTASASLWNSIRKSLKGYYGESIDRSWFSRLEAVEDVASFDATNNTKTSNELVLKAPSNFLKDYIDQHYRHLMDKFCETLSGGSMQLSLRTV